MKTVIERLMSHIKVNENGCWIWTAGTRHDGAYGIFHWCGKPWSSHRAAYTLLVGPIPDGKHLHHLKEICSSTLCCNPAHLSPLTPKEHVHQHDGAAALNSRKTHCIHGHLFDDANTYAQDYRRTCRVCARAKTAAFRKRKYPNPTGRTGRPKGSGLLTHCHRGHPYDEANTRIETNGYRKCRACDRIRALAAYYRKKAA